MNIKHSLIMLLGIAGAVTLPFAADVSYADEGMYLFNNPPTEKLKQDYNFDLTKEWLNKAMKSAVRFNNGGSGGFISSNGLVITNHHIADDTLAKLSTPENDLLAKGFLATTMAEELKAPNLELNCLMSIEDVTSLVNSAVKDNMTVTEKAKARQAKMAEIEKQSLDKTGLRSDIVTLYQGGLYHLYRYKKYTDVRIVWAPEQAIAAFGGDVDNFEYPRYSLDAAIFRVYENGKPLKTKDYFKLNPKGVDEGDLVFVVGHPGTTNRLDTLARLQHYRDKTLPYRLSGVRSREAALKQYAEKGLEQARQAESLIRSQANSRKAYTGMYRGLLDKTVLQRVAQKEQALKKVSTSVQPWENIESSQAQLAEFEDSYALLEQKDAFSSVLFSNARHLVRLAQELPKDSSKRLREYRDSNLESLRLDLFSQEPYYPDMEKARLTASLSFLAERLGGDNPDVQLVLEGKSPQERASELVDKTSLGKAEYRKSLASLDYSSLAKSEDSMIQLAIKIDQRARFFRELYETKVKEPELKNYSVIAGERFKAEGDSRPPDATFTLRLSYGKVKGYESDGKQVPWCTRTIQAFNIADSHLDTPPYRLPESWEKAKDKLGQNTPFVFAATSDTIGGNSGSPVVDRQGMMVGVNFDRNQYGMVRNFVYDETRARHMSVSTPALIEALSKIYGAEHIVNELIGK